MDWLSALYASIARSRRRYYEGRPERQRHLRRPVVSVGNVSVGGSGKTPAVAHIAKLLLDAGERPAILSRGYGRTERPEGVVVVSDGCRMLADVRRAGDEPLMLARTVPGAAVLVHADRHRSGVLAEERLGCSVHLLDDGFQHVQLHRDVDIVLVSPDDLRDRVLPAGRLREDPRVLARADAVVINGDGDVDARVLEGKPVFRARTKLGAGSQEPGAGSRRVFALAGIARPRRFFDLLASSGFRVAGEMTFRDHHRFTPSDLARIIRGARESGAELIVTTEKDLVRLLPLRPFPMPIVASVLEFEIEPARAFAQWLTSALDRAREARRATAQVGTAHSMEQQA